MFELVLQNVLKFNRAYAMRVANYLRCYNTEALKLSLKSCQQDKCYYMIMSDREGSIAIASHIKSLNIKAIKMSARESKQIPINWCEWFQRKLFTKIYFVASSLVSLTQRNTVPTAICHYWAGSNSFSPSIELDLRAIWAIRFTLHAAAAEYYLDQASHKAV